MLYSIIIVLIIGVLALYAFHSNAKYKRINKFIENIVKGNKCCIKHPNYPKELIVVKITKIEGKIITVEGEYKTHNNSDEICYFCDKEIPIEEIYPYQ